MEDRHFTREELNIVEVQGCALMSNEEFFEYYSENRMYLLQLNRELCDKTIGPAESKNALAEERGFERSD